jgi:hypothetical protein
VPRFNPGTKPKMRTTWDKDSSPTFSLLFVTSASLSMSSCTILKYYFNVLLTYKENADTIKCFVAYSSPEMSQISNQRNGIQGIITQKGV